jgi:hypothetical protein
MLAHLNYKYIFISYRFCLQKVAKQQWKFMFVNVNKYTISDQYNVFSWPGVM